jgi:hypothetical protein
MALVQPPEYSTTRSPQVLNAGRAHFPYISNALILSIPSTATMSTPSQGRPAFPDGVSADDIVAIVTIHDPRAFAVNENTVYRKTQSRTPEEEGAWCSEGCNVFLYSIHHQPCYSFGRFDSKGLRSDVLLPRRNVRILQFTLLTVWDSNSWRLQSATETVAYVNDAPIQDITSRTRRIRNRLPYVIHLQ